jgi:hypothetical protein
MALGLATIATIAVVTLYGYAPSPASRPAQALRAASKPQIAELASVLATDWGRVRAADDLWMNTCFAGVSTSMGGCAHALRRQIAVFQRLRDDVRAQRLAGTQLAPIVDGRFLRSVDAALATKMTALRVEASVVYFARHHLRPPQALVQFVGLQPHNPDPLVCIEPVGAAIQRAMGRSTRHPLFLSYPHSLADAVDGRRSCKAVGS